MFAKFASASVLAFGLAAAAFGFGQKDVGARDCCSRNLACCFEGSACCEATARLGCCEQGRACCKENRACCQGVQACCLKGDDCCDQSKACCGPKGTAAKASFDQADKPMKACCAKSAERSAK